MLILSEAPQSLPAIHIASLLIVVQEIDCHVPLFFWGGAYQTSDPCAITRAISHRRYRIGPNNPSHTTSARHKVSATSPLAPGNTKVNQRRAPLSPKKIQIKIRKKDSHGNPVSSSNTGAKQRQRRKTSYDDSLNHDVLSSLILVASYVIFFCLNTDCWNLVTCSTPSPCMHPEADVVGS